MSSDQERTSKRPYEGSLVLLLEWAQRMRTQSVVPESLDIDGLIRDSLRLARRLERSGAEAALAASPAPAPLTRIVYEGFTLAAHIIALELVTNKEPRDTVRVTFDCGHTRDIWRIAFDNWVYAHDLVPVCRHHGPRMKRAMPLPSPPVQP